MRRVLRCTRPTSDPRIPFRWSAAPVAILQISVEHLGGKRDDGIGVGQSHNKLHLLRAYRARTRNVVPPPPLRYTRTIVVDARHEDPWRALTVCSIPTQDAMPQRPHLHPSLPIAPGKYSRPRLRSPCNRTRSSARPSLVASYHITRTHTPTGTACGSAPASSLARLP
ncbi:hypothetical protein PYCCODRAFT_735411 [Trametes coccinea BRFM310]|uniref:Uncharacterized protein n=1 Tax=Trametes coccinea (strain BRFM310) TaxID=1353009 RepID=A0A1Y2IH48_TRAC3|nr:hypothetical protein PYCCODRAFT_735411 [Trametes coccinea BRFM310]